MSSDRFTIDHIMPQSLGGSDELDNLAVFLSSL
ncbi:HNH endonuclease [Nostoc commune]|nr:HNH endonuclease [Nostoc commune]